MMQTARQAYANALKASLVSIQPQLTVLGETFKF